jgi:hypothetical protein
MTSELRSLQAKSIHMGPRISTVITRILEAENGFDQRLEIFPEEIGVRYRNAITQDDHPGRHLSVVYRASQPAFERTRRLAADYRGVTVHPLARQWSAAVHRSDRARRRAGEPHPG